MISNQPTGRKEDMAARRVDVLSLRRDGLSLSAIAARLNVSKRTAGRDLRLCLAELSKQQQDNAAALVALETERLDVALSAIAERVRKGELAAIDRWIRLCESRRRLLGLDAQPAPVGALAGGVTFNLIPMPTAVPVVSRIVEALPDEKEESHRPEATA